MMQRMLLDQIKPRLLGFSKGERREFEQYEQGALGELLKKNDCFAKPVPSCSIILKKLSLPSPLFHSTEKKKITSQEFESFSIPENERKSYPFSVEIEELKSRVLPDWKERKDALSHRRAEMSWCADDGGAWNRFFIDTPPRFWQK